MTCRESQWGSGCNRRCPDNCMSCDRWNGRCESCLQPFWGPNCDRVCSKHCECCDRLSGVCLKCPGTEAAIVVTDGDALNLDYITVIVSVGLSVIVIIIAVLIVFVTRRICRARTRLSSKQLADDISEATGKEDGSVIVPAGEDGYARRPTSKQTMDSNYINVQVPEDGEVKVNGGTNDNEHENGDTFKSRGTYVTHAVSGQDTETVMYTNSAEVRELMHGFDFTNTPRDLEETLRSRGTGNMMPDVQTPHVPEMYTNIDNGQARVDIKRENSLRSRGPTNPAKALEISNSLPQMYTDCDDKDSSNGYLAPITGAKFKQAIERVIQLKGTTSVSSDFQGKPDPGTYIYVDNKARVPRIIAGEMNQSIPEDGMYTNVGSTRTKQCQQPQEPPGWYEELDFTRPVQMYNEIES